MQLHKLAWGYMSLHAVPWTFMKFNELACSFMSLYAVPYVVWAAHKNFAVLVWHQFILRECKIAGSLCWWHTNLLFAADWPIYLFIAWWKSNLCTFKINERQRCISWNLKMKFAKKVSFEYRSNAVLSPWSLLTLASWSNLPNSSLRSLTRSWK